MTIQDLALKIEGRAWREYYKLSGARPSSFPYVSGDSFRALADHKLDGGFRFDPARVREGDIVFLATHELDRFRADVLPRIGCRFVLITHNSDVNIDAGRAALADDERIVAWFAQNAVFPHPKIVPVPIGLENRWHRNNGIVGDYRRLARRKGPKLPRMLYGFSLNTNAAERTPALASLRAMASADPIQWTNSRAYRRQLVRYAFVASPPGNGVDCHRTWEALYLGVIPVVKRSPMYDAFPGAPIAQIGDWKEIEAWDEARLSGMYAELGPRIDRCECLAMGYWKERIERTSLRRR